MVREENLLLREREGEKSMYRRFGGEGSEVVPGLWTHCVYRDTSCYFSSYGSAFPSSCFEVAQRVAQAEDRVDDD